MFQYTTDYKDSFKVDSLTATRSDDHIIFTINYESSKNGGYSFFDPPSGTTIMKINETGVQPGTNTSELTLTLDEFNQVLSCASINMKFKFSDTSSFINFKTAQLQSL